MAPTFSMAADRLAARSGASSSTFVGSFLRIVADGGMPGFTLGRAVTLTFLPAASLAQYPRGG